MLATVSYSYCTATILEFRYSGLVYSAGTYECYTVPWSKGQGVRFHGGILALYSHCFFVDGRAEVPLPFCLFPPNTFWNDTVDLSASLSLPPHLSVYLSLTKGGKRKKVRDRGKKHRSGTEGDSLPPVLCPPYY